jgi:type I restriction enzyme S subunit
MTLDALFEKFGQFADAPNAPTRVREAVLTLAVQGKLFADTTTANWSRVRLGEILASGLSSVNPADTPDQLFELWSVPSYATKEPEILLGNKIGSLKRELPDRSILLAKINPHLNRVWKVARRTRHTLIASPEWITIVPGESWDTNYLARVLASPGFKRELCSTAQGIGSLTRASIKKAAEIEILRPPLAEQVRIAAKVDELMALCDHLETQQQERDRQKAVLARVSLANFVAAPTTKGLDVLFHPSCGIPPVDLRTTVQTVAVQGKLIAQDSRDEPVQISFPGLVPVNSNSRRETSIPPDWKLCSYRSLSSLVTSGSRGWKQFYSATGAIFIRTQNINSDKLILDDVAFVDLPKSAEGKRARVLKNDILITITGANVTKAARVEHRIPEAYVSQHIALTRPRWPKLSPWIHLCFVSPGSARGTLQGLAYGDKPGLNLNHIRDLIIPVPPLAEQHRILEKVAQLMALIDQLETQLAASRLAADNLLEAFVAELTGIKRKADHSAMPQNRTVMKSKPRAFREPLKLSTRNFVLRRFAMQSGYRSIRQFDCTYHSDTTPPDEASPICLVGLNGSGKSNLIEAIAEVFCFQS